MRTRSSISSQSASWSQHYDQFNGTCGDPWRKTVNQNYSGTLTSYYESRTMHDVVTPSFYRLRREGKIINNPYDQEIVMEWISPVTVTQNLVHFTDGCSPPSRYYDGWRISGSADWSSQLKASYLPAPYLNVESIKDQAITDAFAKAAVNDAMIGATLGEMRETVSGLVAVFKRMAGIAMAIKRFNLKALRKEISPKEIANRYMEYRYGIRPLVYDVLQIIDALNNDVRPVRWAVRDFATDSATTERSNHVIINNGFVKAFVHNTTAREVNARSGVLLVIDRISTLQKWGADKFLTTAWELVPLSFVVDWFCNLGKVVASWEPTIGMKHLASWVVVSDTTTHTAVVSGTECLWPTSNIQEKSFSASGQATKVYKYKYRVPNPNIPIMPRFNVNLDALKLLDLGLIIRGAFR